MLTYAFQQDKQTLLKLRLFVATFTEQKDISDRDTLLNEAKQIGFDIEQARSHLQDANYRDEVIQQELYWQSLGISAVPSMVFNRKSIISGAQTVAFYKKVLMELLNK